jgi:hypothetical protein
VLLDERIRDANGKRKQNLAYFCIQACHYAQVREVDRSDGAKQSAALYESQLVSTPNDMFEDVTWYEHNQNAVAIPARKKKTGWQDQLCEISTSESRLCEWSH